MSQTGNQPNNFGSHSVNEEARIVESTLKGMTRELKTLQQNVLLQLNQDINRLQAEKNRLVDEVEHLRSEQQKLQAQQAQSLSRRDAAQQQLWAKQLAQVLAIHLQELLKQRLDEMAQSYRHANGGSPPSLQPSSSTNGYSDNAYKLLASLDATFSSTFRTLQQELNSYQSSLSEQLNQMHSMEQQGTTILEALVARLREQLEAETRRLQSEMVYRTNGYGQLTTGERVERPSSSWGSTSSLPSQTSFSPPSVVPSPPSSRPAPPRTEAKPKPMSQINLGVIMILLSTLALSVHNVVVQILGSNNQLLGLIAMGGYIKPSLGNSLMTLWVRMLVVVPLMIVIAGVLYPPVWKDIKRFLLMRDRRPLFIVAGSGAFLFLSQVLIYIAIPILGPGVAVTILFMYPILTVPLAWVFFGDRPTLLRLGVMAMITAGVVLAALPKIQRGGAPALQALYGLGLWTAIISGVAFALYLIFMQMGFKKLHPVPVSLVQFTTIFILTSLSLMVDLPSDLKPHVLDLPGFLVSCLVLGVLTLAGYLLNNFGVRYMGAGPASIIASSGPALTAILAFLLLPNSINNRIWPIQIIGIILVTLGVTALSFERMKNQAKPAK
ncbi:hypothetical protein BST81_00380 [Leptolyngbya sp. 'hensonii']|uniref:DMT family transporter n=1 Tax=Leptolyngbya sp. 'hensonii' TaxID=1922337 RepID=UPI000950036E|nr:DMT family transporter [Leptolyngbya sp. 'hensonii']OLP20236.1 hypothetical protein BST81_00380 [Leptolyngbya sp. 'hensonii']